MFIQFTPRLFLLFSLMHPIPALERSGGDAGNRMPGDESLWNRAGFNQAEETKREAGGERLITFTDSLDGISSCDLRGFFVGWPDPPSPEKHLRMLLGSDHVVLAVDGETGVVVGFINGLSDGAACAFIPLLEVLPAYQGRGIGSELMRRMLVRLESMAAVDLMCDPGLQPFYSRFGMKPLTGMAIRRPSRAEADGPSKT